MSSERDYQECEIRATVCKLARSSWGSPWGLGEGRHICTNMLLASRRIAGEKAGAVPSASFCS